MIIETIMSTFLQITIATLIPFIYYLVISKKITGFLSFLGFFQPTKRGIYVATLLFAIVFIITLFAFFYIPTLNEAMNSPSSVTGVLKERSATTGFSLNILCVIILIAWFQTALAEEIFFRGFLAKQLINRFGFHIGNGIQAIIFGAVHGGIFILSPEILNPSSLIILLAYPTFIGYLFGYINEKVGNGSILLSWGVHGLSNFIAYLAFILFT